MDVRKEEFYPELLKVSQEAVKDLQKKGWELAEIYWRWGVALAAVKTEYGEQTITSIAEDVDKHYTTLYRARAVGAKYQTLVALKEAWTKGEEGGRAMSWNRLTKALPSPTDDPDAYGGQTRVVDQLMYKVESQGDDIEKLKDFLDAPELDEDTKRQIVGVLAQVSVTAVNIEGDYMDYLRSCPCIECGAEALDAWVLVLIGLPEQTQFTAIPLCIQHFREMRKDGQGQFRQRRGLNYKAEIANLLVPYYVAKEAELENNSQG